MPSTLVLLRYQLKTPYHDDTTHVIFELLDFIVRLMGLDDLSAAPEAHFPHRHRNVS